MSTRTRTASVSEMKAILKMANRKIGALIPYDIRTSPYHPLTIYLWPPFFLNEIKIKLLLIWGKKTQKTKHNVTSANKAA